MQPRKIQNLFLLLLSLCLFACGGVQMGDSGDTMTGGSYGMFGVAGNKGVSVISGEGTPNLPDALYRVVVHSIEFEIPSVMQGVNGYIFELEFEGEEEVNFDTCILIDQAGHPLDFVDLGGRIYYMSYYEPSPNVYCSRQQYTNLRRVEDSALTSLDSYYWILENYINDPGQNQIILTPASINSSDSLIVSFDYGNFEYKTIPFSASGELVIHDLSSEWTLDEVMRRIMVMDTSRPELKNTMVYLSSSFHTGTE